MSDTNNETVQEKQQEAVLQEQKDVKKKITKKRVPKKSESIILVKSKRKRAIARARVKKGNGVIKINSRPIEVYEPREIRRLMMEPILVSKTAHTLSSSVDIEVKVNGGGMMAQAHAVRGAIAKGLSEYSGNDIIKNDYLQHDRSIIVDDFRRVEPKKPNRTKARARSQTSYR